ncbi:MAG: hypothetical protein ACT4NU_12835 [Chromatiales bacterium]
MKIIQVIPVANDKPTLTTLLKETERKLRGKGTTLLREKEGRWVHTKYPGWINWDLGKGGVLMAEIQSKKQNAEWQLLQSFIGYIDRHLGDHVQAIIITYMD